MRVAARIKSDVILSVLLFARQVFKPINTPMRRKMAGLVLRCEKINLSPVPKQPGSQLSIRPIIARVVRIHDGLGERLEVRLVAIIVGVRVEIYTIDSIHPDILDEIF